MAGGSGAVTPALVLAAGANDPGLVQACGAKGEQSWVCSTIYRITGDATAADVADALVEADPHRRHPRGRVDRGARRAGVCQPLREAPQRWCRAARHACVRASRSSTRSRCPTCAALQRTHTIGAVLRSVAVDADLVDRGAHHPRRARREPRAAARGRGHRRHRARLRRAVAGPRLPLAASSCSSRTSTAWAT